MATGYKALGLGPDLEPMLFSDDADTERPAAGMAELWFFGTPTPEPPATSMIDYIITFVRRRGR